MAGFASSDLNKNEAKNALARAVFFNRLGELRDRSVEDQRYRAIRVPIGAEPCQGRGAKVAFIQLRNKQWAKVATFRVDFFARRSRCAPRAWEH
jgi:hypothetical protein